MFKETTFRMLLHWFTGFLFVRHANTDALPPERDMERVLTETAYRQCHRAQAWFAPMRSRAILRSPAGRCLDTAALMYDGRDFHSLIIPSLYTPYPKNPGSAAFEEHWPILKYAPMELYIAAGWDWRKFADFVLAEIVSLIPRNQMHLQLDHRSKQVLPIFGHGVHPMAVALRMAEIFGLDESHKSTIINTMLGETDGMLITPKTVQHFYTRM